MSKVYFSCPKFTVLLVMRGPVIVEAAPIVKTIRGADDRCPDLLGTIPVWRADHRAETPAVPARKQTIDPRIPTGRRRSFARFFKNRR